MKLELLGIPKSCSGQHEVTTTFLGAFPVGTLATAERGPTRRANQSR
jgi:hypothetical protein